MAARPVLPETAVAAVRRYCEQKIPPEHRDQARVEWAARGKSITLFECRAPWHPDRGPEWSRVPIAQLRYEPADHHWQLYCADRNSRWHRYELAEPTAHIAALLEAIDRDPTGIFWG